jgi:hypothetical protein
MTQATLPKPSQEFTIKQLSSANTNSKKALVAIRGKVCLINPPLYLILIYI